VAQKKMARKFVDINHCFRKHFFSLSTSYEGIELKLARVTVQKL